MKKPTLFLAVAIILFSTNIFAQDPPRKSDKKGSKDYGGILRYKGAIIQEYQVSNYTDFWFGLDEPVRKDFLGHGQFFKKYIETKGKLTNIQYLIPIDESVLKVYENYQNALTISGYNILYTERNVNSCFYREDLFGGDAGPISKVPDGYYGVECDKDYYYVVAKGIKDSVAVYVGLYIGTGGNWGQRFVIVNQSVVEAVPLELGLVKADNISQNIDITGHSIFYDIHFATGSAKVDVNSDNQINEIATYLKANSDKKYYIVGHTDNVGEFSANMRLSEDRANAVMTELITKYGVSSERLKAYGIANLFPVVSNSTDIGKDRNRRVEIVEQ